MLHFRTEQEITAELALIAVRKTSYFEDDGSQYSLPNGRGQRFVYDTAYLDIRFIEDGHCDTVIQFTSTLAPDAPCFYCLLSELENADESDFS